MAFQIRWDEHWVQVFALSFMAVGFIIAGAIRNPFLNIIAFFLCGFVCGRVWAFKRHSEPILPFVLMIGGFIVGYFLGSFWVNRFVNMLFFALGFGISYYLHKREIIVIFKSPSFHK